MPKQLNRSAIRDLAALSSDDSELLERPQGAVGNPMEVLPFMENLNLPREKNSIAALFKERAQLLHCPLLRRVGGPLVLVTTLVRIVQFH